MVKNSANVIDKALNTASLEAAFFMDSKPTGHTLSDMRIEHDSRGRFIVVQWKARVFDKEQSISDIIDNMQAS